MAEGNWPAGYGRRVYQRLDSTLDEARRIAGEVAGPEWIIAHEQTAGRGRRGRAWQSPTGNFMATLTLRPEGPAQHVALRSFVAALALREALVAASGREDAVALKWPNDVLLRGGKVAGILLESIGSGRGVNHLAIGIGVNLAHAPPQDAVEDGAVRPVSVRENLGVTISPGDFLDLLAASYARLELQFCQQGFAPIRRAWLDHAARLGETLTARTGTQETTGRFVDVDADGQLVLETRKGPVHIPAADIYF